VPNKKLKIGIIAAEHSGDRLGADLLGAIQNHYEVEIFGLGGPEVTSLGISTPDGIHYQDLQVMGLTDPLLKLPKLLSIRKKISALFAQQKIDIFIGVDSPDFNMFFHKKLKGLGIKTVQVVSPSVWGWRENRIKAIGLYIDLTMCLFQFEHDFYLKKGMNSFFLGHPFSDLKPSATKNVLEKYQLNRSKDFICILPGSRKSEILHMMPIFIQAAERIFENNGNAFFLIPAANTELKALIQNSLEQTKLNYQLTSSAAKDYLSISKISIVTSGTASLEAAVLGSLPIICYKTNPFNYAILSRMLKTPFIGLPNLLLQQHVFPELVQYELNPEAIVHHYENLSLDPHKYQSQIAEMNTAMQGKGFEEAAHLLLSL
tara:strand:- start:403 stop:1524 length:1122 start_codon:yes stop_codon:yes gene_type:complete